MAEEMIADGIDTSTADEGLGEDVESPEVVEGDVEEGESADIPEETEEEGEQEEAEETEEPVETTVDGRKMPDGVKKALAAIRATDPKAAGILKDQWYTNQTYREAFPTPQEAMAVKETYESLGGAEGIAAIEAERGEWQALDSMYGEGNPEFIKNIAEANPEGFVKMAPQAINEWASRAPEQYSAFAQQLTVNMLKRSGVVDELVNAYHGATDNPQLQAAIAGVYNKIADMDEKAQKFAVAQSQNDPRESKIKEERTQLETERRAMFEEGIYEDAQKYLESKTVPEIERILSGRASVTDRHKQLVAAEVERRLAAMPGFAANLDKFYASKDRNGSLSYIKQQYDKIVADAVKSEIEPLYRKINPTGDKKVVPGQKTQRPAGSGEAGTVFLKEMPQWQDIDFTKCTTADVAAGKAVLKNGKRASGWI